MILYIFQTRSANLFTKSLPRNQKLSIPRSFKTLSSIYDGAFLRKQLTAKRRSLFSQKELHYRCLTEFKIRSCLKTVTRKSLKSYRFHKCLQQLIPKDLMSFCSAISLRLALINSNLWNSNWWKIFCSILFFSLFSCCCWYYY